MTPFLLGSLPHCLVVLPEIITQVNCLHCPKSLSTVKVEENHRDTRPELPEACPKSRPRGWREVRSWEISVP